MTELPNNFDSWEHLQRTYMLEYNKRVDRYFSDVQGNGDLSAPRNSLKLACRLTDADNIATWNLRTSLFFDVLGYSRKNLITYFGSIDNLIAPVTGHPKLYFYFSRDAASIPPGEDSKTDAEYSVRLMKYESTSPNLRQALIDIANEIKIQFVDNKRGIILTKGNLGVTYTDPKNGFSKGRRVLCNQEADAIDIYRRICNVIDVPFDEQKIGVNNPKRPSTTANNTGTVTILGKTRKKKAYRPIVNVRFRYSYVEVPGEPNPVYLIDTTRRYKTLVNL